MDCALIFNNDGSSKLVTAEEVKAGIYSRHDYEFVDPEYEFKVQYVKGSKNNGRPYFRLYYSYEDYKLLHPESADRYKIVANMRRYAESQWHKTWKERVSSFCEIEKWFKNSELNKWKFADAYNFKTNTCIEFQHSYIAFDYEERNLFYSSLGISTIWLYDLPDATTHKREDGRIEILEDNSNGFFRISEKPDNLSNYPVFIQVKSGAIYRVTQLDRLTSESGYKSSIRCFSVEQEFSEDSFTEFLRTNCASETESEELIGSHNSGLVVGSSIAEENPQTLSVTNPQQDDVERPEAEQPFSNNDKIPSNKQPKENNCEEYLLELLLNSDGPVRYHNSRWVMCKFCEKPYKASECTIVKIDGNCNLGVCSSCAKREDVREKLYDTPLPAKKKYEPTCPLCGEILIKRTGRYGSYWECSNFPSCKYRHSTEGI